MLYLIVLLVSSALLAHEIVLMRILAIAQWSHLAYMVISVALLGFGASGAVVLIGGERLRRRSGVVVAGSSLLFATSIPLATGLVLSVELNVLELPWRMGQLWRLGATVGAATVPFLLGATVIATALTTHSERTSLLYAANLLGSGLGAWGAVALLGRFRPGQIPLILFWVGWFAAAGGAMRVRSRGGRIALMALVLTATPLGLGLYHPAPGGRIPINPFKALAVTLKMPRTEVVAEAWGPMGRLDLVRSPFIREVPDKSLRYVGSPPPQMLLFVDGETPSPVNLWHRREELAVFDHTPQALAYHLRRPATVCVIGAGGGTDIDLAYYHNARRITAVEVNGGVIRLLTNLRGGRGPYHPEVMERVEVVISEGRAFLERTRRRFDLIQISLIDSFAASTAGVYALDESYLYTVEALRTCLRRLNRNGLVSITRWQKRPARDVIKLFATAVEALRREGLEPSSRLVLIRRLRTATLLLSPDPLDSEDVRQLRTFCRQREFDLCYYPGIRPEEVNRYHRFDEPIYYRACRALLSLHRGDFTRQYPFDIRPTTDDRPFFFHFFRPRMLLRVQETLGRNWRPFVEWGYVVVLATLATTGLLGTFLILLPLVALRLGKRGASHKGVRKGVVLVLCTSLGLAFLFLEMAFIQKFALFLSHPLYAITVVIAGFLVLAGVGSLLGGWVERKRGWVGWAAGLAVALVSLVYISLLDPLLKRLLVWPEGGRVAVTMLLLVPLAVPMGLPFPLILRRLGRDASGLVPWAWGVNGCASVVAAPLATALAVSLGFRAVVMVAAGLYVLVAVLFPRLTRPDRLTGAPTHH